MSTAIVRVVDVYPYRTVGAGRVQFLLLRRAPGVAYAGEWRMVAGKIQEGEAAWQAALREVQEETGHTPQRLWVVPSLNAFYEWQHDRVNLIPAFAAALDADPHRNHEHDDDAWLAPEAAAGRLVWPEQRRLLLLIDRCLRTGVSPDLIIPL